ncbi:unnamed protein product [Clonostachys rhizophaga]|uniref:Amine oxidase n=1 Tax=Clonostachys rhizophaga TaxID=160324 RepID=A0A9N9YJB2_9HYPO|nr:unnamed protein product [Clonostachys rhizophaga]
MSAVAAKESYLHPLDPATAEEIEKATALVKQLFFGIPLHFKAAGLDEPPKRDLSAYLDAEHEGRPLPPLPRRVFVEQYQELPRDFHGPVDRAEMKEAAEVVMKDPNIDDTTIVLDPWDFGVDGTETQERHTQVFMYICNPENNDPDSCHYSFPLDFMVIVDLVAMKVKKILRLPLGVDQKTTEKNPPRTTMKPYQVIQPEGASFTVKGHLIEWEKFRFCVGFNWREGTTIHDVSFMGRKAFYRLSLSEMFVPYGDPRNPIYRKGAFDLGNVGAGVTANNLALGCDCLGVIKYLGGHVVGNDGTAVEKPNAICIHEVDQGIQWKHTNHRTKNATVVRKRQLVLQQIITVANYEYIFAWIFDQSGEITYETRATGILSTQPIDADAKVPWGTRVGDGVMAPYHQHIFNVRIDPAVGGRNNSFVYSGSVRMDWDEELNPLGTGYVTKETTFHRASSVQDSVADGRVFKIVNPNIENPPGSWHWRRSEFCEAPMWVTKYQDRQLFPAGDYTNQSLGGTGIKSWTTHNPDPVVNEDIVAWHTFGFNHIPRVEDFPIMPAEIAQMHLKPYNFCNYNPTNDVPPSNQEFNKSVLYEDQQAASADLCCRNKL